MPPPPTRARRPTKVVEIPKESISMRRSQPRGSSNSRRMCAVRFDVAEGSGVAVLDGARDLVFLVG